MSVADTLRRNRKMTAMTRKSVRTSVNFTSATDSRIVAARSYIKTMLTLAGICFCNSFIVALTASATWTVLVPGWRWMARITPRVPEYQAIDLLF